MWAVIPFFLALILLAAFLGFLAWEEKRRVRLFREARERLDRRITALYERAVMGGIPERYRTMAIQGFRSGLHAIVVFVAGSLRSAERSLTRISYRMRISAAASADRKKVSPFLKTIMPKKNSESETPGDTTSDRV